MRPKFQHTCGICQRRFYTFAEADAHAFDHECARTEQVADADAPLYTLVTLDEHTEYEFHNTPDGDHAMLRAAADYANSRGDYYTYDVAFWDVSLNSYADVLAEIATLTAAEIAEMP